MRNPLRDEGAAFRGVFVVLAAFALLALASWVHTWLGVAVAATELAAGVLAVRRIRRAPSVPVAVPVEAGQTGGDGDAAPARLLVVLGPDGADDDDLLGRAVRSLGPRASALVLVPALDPRTRGWSAAAEARVRTAQERLGRALALLAAAGAACDGRLDDVDVERAVDGALRGFAPTEALVSGRIAPAAAERLATRLGLTRES